MSETQTKDTAVKTSVPVTFRKHTRHGITFTAGSIFEDWCTDENTDGLIWIIRGDQAVRIHMDDATPVEWDETDQMWIEE